MVDTSLALTKERVGSGRVASALTLLQPEKKTMAMLMMAATRAAMLTGLMVAPVSRWEWYWLSRRDEIAFLHEDRESPGHFGGFTTT